MVECLRFKKINWRLQGVKEVWVSFFSASLDTDNGLKGGIWKVNQNGLLKRKVNSWSVTCICPFHSTSTLISFLSHFIHFPSAVFEKKYLMCGRKKKLCNSNTLWSVATVKAKIILINFAEQKINPSSL